MASFRPVGSVCSLQSMIACGTTCLLSTRKWLISMSVGVWFRILRKMCFCLTHTWAAFKKAKWSSSTMLKVAEALGCLLSASPTRLWRSWSKLKLWMLRQVGSTISRGPCSSLDYQLCSSMQSWNQWRVAQATTLLSTYRDYIPTKHQKFSSIP